MIMIPWFTEALGAGGSRPSEAMNDDPASLEVGFPVTQGDDGGVSLAASICCSFSSSNCA